MSYDPFSIGRLSTLPIHSLERLARYLKIPVKMRRDERDRPDLYKHRVIMAILRMRNYGVQDHDS